MMAPAARLTLIEAGTPNSSPTPASPDSSVISAPRQATASVETESQAQPRPKCRAISSPWPCPVTTPSRTVSSCTI